MDEISQQEKSEPQPAAGLTARKPVLDRFLA